MLRPIKNPQNEYARREANRRNFINTHIAVILIGLAIMGISLL